MAFTKKLLICTIIILAISIVAGLLPIHGESEIYDTVVRLHVVANSDSEEDQALKLKVRDAIIEVTGRAVKDCRTQAEAIAAIGAVMDEIESAAREVIEREGYCYEVAVEIGEEYYPTKTYESCAFPEGEYVSLRVLSVTRWARIGGAVFFRRCVSRRQHPRMSRITRKHLFR